jgi:hypothetical protein
MSDAKEEPGQAEDSSVKQAGVETGETEPVAASEVTVESNSEHAAGGAEGQAQSESGSLVASADSFVPGPNAAATSHEQPVRRSSMESAVAALKYVGQASSTDQVQVRTSDRLTVIALLVCCIVEVLSLVYTPLAGYRLLFIGFSDLVLSIAVICFLVVRLGILSTLSERQVIICWQLMMGCVFLGIFLCVNVACGVAFLVSSLNPSM